MDLQKTKIETQTRSSDYFKLLLDNLSELVLVFSKEGIIKYSSPAIKNMIGYLAEEVEGLSIFSLIHPDFIDKLKTHYSDEEDNNADVQKINLTLLHKNGLLINVIGHVNNLLSNKDINGIVITLKDLTELTIANSIISDQIDKLKLNELLLNAVEKLSLVGGWEYDVNNKNMYWTEETYLIHDLDRVQILFPSDGLIQESLNCYLPADRERVLTAFNKCVNEGVGYDLQFFIISAKGKGKYIRTKGQAISKNGKISKVIGTFADITKIKQTELLAEARYRIINDSYHLNLEDFLQKVLDEAEILTQSKIGFYHFVEDDQQTLSLQAWSTNTIEHMCKAEGKGLHYNISEAGVWVDCVKERRTIVHNDYESLAHKKGLPEGHAPVIRELVVPLFRDEKIVAILGVGNKPNYYDDNDIEMITKLADLAWDVTERKKAEEKLRSSKEELKELYLAQQEHNKELLLKNEELKDARLKNLKIIEDLSHEISEHKKVQELLKVNEQKFKTVADYTYDWEYWVGVKNEIIYMSPACERITGYTREDFVNNKDLLQSIVIPEDEVIFSDHMNENSQLPLVEKVEEIEFRIKRKDNSIAIIQHICRPIFGENNTFLGRRISNRDVTEKKISEKALLESEEKNRALLNAIPDLIFVMNNEGKFIDYKCDDETQLFANPDKFIGKNIREVLSENLAKLTSEKINKLLTTKQTQIFEYEMDLSDEKKYYENRLIILDQNLILSIVREITEQKKITQELIEAKEKAEEMNKVKSYFFANMSHELRTPFVGILGFAELLVDSLRDEELHHYAQQILKSGRRLTDTLNKILNITRFEFDKFKLNLKKIDVNNLIEETSSLFAKAASDNKSIISLDLNKNLPGIKTDEKLLEEILNNLVSNAVKYTQNGSILITSDKTEINGIDHLEIKVADTGAGIPENLQPVIWREFRQASEGYNRSFEGTGLGLTITKKCVELLGGTINLQSAEGKGSVFTFQLPIAEDEAASEIKKDILLKKTGTVAQRLQYRPKLLYVEDDQTSLDYILIILRSGYDVDTAITAQKAIELLEKNQYDILMVDINLGRGMDGVEFMQHVRKLESYNNTPIIAVTAYAAKSDKAEFLAKGFTHYLSKPFLSAELKSLLNSVMS